MLQRTGGTVRLSKAIMVVFNPAHEIFHLWAVLPRRHQRYQKLQTWRRWSHGPLPRPNHDWGVKWSRPSLSQRRSHLRYSPPHSHTLLLTHSLYPFQTVKCNNIHVSSRRETSDTSRFWETGSGRREIGKTSIIHALPTSIRLSKQRRHSTREYLSRLAHQHACDNRKAGNRDLAFVVVRRRCLL